MKEFDISVKQFVVRVDPTFEHPLNCEYESDSRETVIRTPFLEPLIVQMTSSDRLTLHFERVELRLSEDAIRQMFETLPPEMLH